MSRAYREWKENRKECRRNGLVFCDIAPNFPNDGISLADYRKFRRQRQKMMKFLKKFYPTRFGTLSVVRITDRQGNKWEEE